MASFITFVRSRIATRRFLKVLPWRLRQDYEHRGPYTPEQVEATIRRHKIANPAFARYAQAIFCDRDMVERLWRDRGVNESYDEIRADIGGAYFGGDAAFTAADAARYSSETGGGSESGHGAHGGHGGEHSGDGGGGHH